MSGLTEVVLWLVFILIFPGILFVSFWALFLEWIDRRIYARMQNRYGPPWYQPEADFLKLLAKEDILPEKADRNWFQYTPLVAFASVMTAYILMPFTFFYHAFDLPDISFEGSLIVIIYLMTIPTIALFIAGWTSGSPFATVGAFRTATMIFSYEVPLLIAVLSPAILAGTWDISKIAEYYSEKPLAIVVTLMGFCIALIALQAKLERLPFDLPEAETEIVGGTLVEYTGKKLAMFRLTTDMQMIAGATLLASVFTGGFNPVFITKFVEISNPWALFGIGVAKFLLLTFIIVCLLAFMKSAMARIKIDQMAEFSWKYLAIFALIQVCIVIVVKIFDYFANDWGWL